MCSKTASLAFRFVQSKFGCAMKGQDVAFYQKAWNIINPGTTHTQDWRIYNMPEKFKTVIIKFYINVLLENTVQLKFK